MPKPPSKHQLLFGIVQTGPRRTEAEYRKLKPRQLRLRHPWRVYHHEKTTSPR